MMFNCGAQNVGINSTGATPNTSAILDVESTSAGLLLPRMTTTQRNLIVSTANSLMIFNIPKLNRFSGNVASMKNILP